MQLDMNHACRRVYTIHMSYGLRQNESHILEDGKEWENMVIT